MAVTVVEDSMAADTSVINNTETTEMAITSMEDTSAGVIDDTTDMEVLAYTSGEADKEPVESSMIPVVLAGVTGSAVIIGGTAFWIKKRKDFSR
jgi:hypothetical protein